jgi:hypothetical protein
MVADWERWRLHVAHAIARHALPVPLLSRLASARVAFEEPGDVA